MRKRMSHYSCLCGIIFLVLLSTACIGQPSCDSVRCGTVCRGDDLWEQKCIGGECVDYQMIERKSEECWTDPCKNVDCENGCYGSDLWKMKCLEGECVPDYIVEKNAEQCGPPDTTAPPPPPPPTDTDNDGVPDVDDDCHNPGCTIVDAAGCPKDSDNDGLGDCYDKCPNVAGEKAYDGCWKPGIIGWEDGIPIIDWRYADQFYGEYVIVEGIVVDTYNSGKACFLNFHKDYTRYFSAVIFASDFYKFSVTPEVYYLEKKVRIRGVVQEYEGKPEIIVESPSQIEVIS